MVLLETFEIVRTHKKGEEEKKFVSMVGTREIGRDILKKKIKSPVLLKAKIDGKL